MYNSKRILTTQYDRLRLDEERVRKIISYDIDEVIADNNLRSDIAFLMDFYPYKKAGEDSYKGDLYLRSLYDNIQNLILSKYGFSFIDEYLLAHSISLDVYVKVFPCIIGGRFSRIVCDDIIEDECLEVYKIYNYIDGKLTKYSSDILLNVNRQIDRTYN